MKKVLLTGANGFLGQHLSLFLQNKGYNIIATGKGPCRIPGYFSEYADAQLTDSIAAANLLKQYKPDVIIHNAALSKPDECENNRDYCLAVNVETTRQLLASAVGHFIYISTDFVFGDNGPHSETAVKAPLNFYGETKLLSENLVIESGVKTTIVRPVFIYGKVWEGMRPSFLHWVKNNLVLQKPIRVVSDQLRTPSYVQDLCRGIEKIIEKEAAGEYHLAGKDIISPYKMAVTTAEVLGLDVSLIESVTAETFPEPVKRAKRSGLRIEKAIRDLGYEPVSFEEGVRLTSN